MQAANKPLTVMLFPIFTLVLDGVKLLNTWSAAIIEQSAYKYHNPISDEEYKAKGGKNTEYREYEKVVRYNYSPEELYALVDVVGMVKGWVHASVLLSCISHNLA